MPVIAQSSQSRNDYGASVESSFERNRLAPQLSRLNSTLIAALVSASVLVAASWVGLPLLAGAAFYLYFAVEHDLRTSRIPNWLNAVGLLAALALAYFLGGSRALTGAAVGAVFAVLPAFVLYRTGLLGAGDAKGIAVLGAVFGPLAVPGLFFWMLLAGGVLSMGLLSLRGEFSDFLGRWVWTLRELLLSRRFVHQRPKLGSAAAGGLPFALCMAFGSLAQALWRVS